MKEVYLVPLVFEEETAKRVTLDLKDRSELLGHKVNVANQVQEVLQAKWDHPVQKVIQVHLVQLGLWEPLANRVFRDQWDRQALWVLRVQPDVLVLLDSLVHVESQVKEGLLAHLGRLEVLDQPEQLVTLVQMVNVVPWDQEVRLVIAVTMASRVEMALRVRRVFVVSKVLLAVVELVDFQDLTECQVESERLDRKASQDLMVNPVRLVRRDTRVMPAL